MSRCIRCHRVLTDPAAIASGYGAICYAKVFGAKPIVKRKQAKIRKAKRLESNQINGQLSVYDFLVANEQEKSADHDGQREDAANG